MPHLSLLQLLGYCSKVGNNGWGSKCTSGSELLAYPALICFLNGTVNSVENQSERALHPVNYWRLWLLNAVLVSAGVLIFLATQYGTVEFFGVACLMALIPFIPIVVLVGGAGSWIFILTKDRLDQRAPKTSVRFAFLVGPGLVFFALCLLLAAGKTPGRRLAYVCHGAVPASASQVCVTGYSTYLEEEWLAVFHADSQDFQSMVAKAQLAPADGFEFRMWLDKSTVKKTKLFSSVPSPDNLPCFKRVFNAHTEHERGAIFAVYDAKTSTAVVIREYHD